MRWIHDLDDLDNMWRPLCEAAKAREAFVARRDNLVQVNEFLDRQGPMLLQLREKLRTE